VPVYIDYSQPIIVMPAAVAPTVVAPVVVAPNAAAPALTAPALAAPNAPASSTVAPVPALEVAQASGPVLEPTPNDLDRVAPPPAAQPPGSQLAGDQPSDPDVAAKPSLSNNQEKALSTFDTARSLFQRGDYQLALAETNRAIALAPNDTLMHEFRALCLFATEDYQQSAAAVYAVLSIGPGWDWATVSGLYPEVNKYTLQLRLLEDFCNDNPQTAYSRFLLAYHYMLQGHNDEAANELATVVKLEPKDRLAAQLHKGLTAKPDDKNASGPAIAPSATPAAAPVEQASVIGEWKSSRDDGSQFELTLTKDNKFTWKFTQADKVQNLSGTYTLANNYLILSASDQNALVGQVAIEPGNKLKFKLAGGSPSDEGLLFTK